MPEKKGRGGKRTPSEGKKIGRPKSTRPVDGNVARKIKARVKAEELWVFTVMTAAKKAKETGNTADLRNALEYLDNRDLGNTTDNVNHMHDKPLEVNATLSLGEGMKLAMERADERLRKHKR
jgi:hypothetical protein